MLTPLELRLEVSKRISNARFDFLKRVYNWQATDTDRSRVFVGERYVTGDMHLHIHFCSSERMGCLTFEANNPPKVFLQPGMHGDPNCSAARNDMPMLVHIGNVAESKRPIASVVRLKPLNACDMCGVETDEHGLAVSGEVLCRVHNRKLRALLQAAGIEFCEKVDEIIQGCPKVVTNLPHQSAEPDSRECLRWKSDVYRAVGRLWIKIEGDGVSLFLKDTGDFPLKFLKVFLCSSYSFEAAVKRVLEVMDHA